jgi:hypothetical protein
MKFKVGDKVKVVDSNDSGVLTKLLKENPDRIFTISAVGEEGYCGILEQKEVH